MFADFRMKLRSYAGFLDDSESLQNCELMAGFDALDGTGVADL